MEENVFAKIKESVSIKQVIEFYTGNRFKKGKALCFAHSDKTPSLSVKNGDRNRCRCFVCCKTWDIFDFAEDFLGLELMDGAKRINKDFKLGIDMDKPLEVSNCAIDEYRISRQAERKFEWWCRETTKGISECLRQIEEEIKEIEWKHCDDFSDDFCTLSKLKNKMEYLFEIMMFGSEDDKVELKLRDKNKWVRYGETKQSGKVGKGRGKEKSI